MRKILLIAVAAVLAVAVAGIAFAAAVGEPAKSYGGCVSKSTGYLRVLERNNLTASVDGKCKPNERKITWYSRKGLPLPSKLVFKRAAGTETCEGTSRTSEVWTFTCTTPSPSPSPSPSASSTPTPTPAS